MTAVVCLVTGAASGIGRAAAELIARTGPVVLADVDADRLDEVAAGVRDRGGTAVAVTCDVRDPESCAAAVAAAEPLGPLADLVSSAGVLTGDGPLLDSPPEVWRTILEVNLVGPANIARAALPALLAAGGGDVVLVGSVAGLQGRPGVSAYSASKAGLLGLQRSLVADYGRAGIRANAVCPGSTATPMSGQVGRWLPNTAGGPATPEQVAAVIAWLVSDASDHVAGVVLPVDAGETAVSARAFPPPV